MGMLPITVILLLVAGGWFLLTRGRRTTEREALTMRRVDAYIETIRRERRNVDLAAMSDSELRDLLHAGARNYHVAGQRRYWILLGVAAVTLFSGIVIATHDGWRGFGIAALVGAVAAYGTNEFLIRRARAPLDRYGIDVDRLIVE